MKSQEFLVFIDIEERTYFVGRLWCYFRNGRETASFEYDQSWLGFNRPTWHLMSKVQRKLCSHTFVFILAEGTQFEKVI